MLVGQAIVVPRRLNVPLNVVAFFRGTVRGHIELLHHQGPRDTNNSCRRHHQHRSHRGNPEIPQENGREERRCHHNGYDEQHNLRGQHRVDVGEGTTGERRMVLG